MPRRLRRRKITTTTATMIATRDLVKRGPSRSRVLGTLIEDAS
jgi:hypothetical protein